MRREPRRTVVVLAALLVAGVVAGLSLGSVELPAAGVTRALLGAIGLRLETLTPLEPASETILWVARLPRVLLAALVGGGLAVVGAALRAVFRNPMAESGLLGVGSGAALGAVAAVHLGWAERVFLALPLAAFAGALTAVLAVYLLAHTWARPTLYGLLLTGLAVAAFMSAGTSMLLVTTQEYRVKTVLFWLAGGLEGRGMDHLRLAAGFVLVGVAALVALARPLDLLSLGEDEAAALGLRVHAARLLVLGICALVAGAATAAAGTVPFVGLVAPHALRPLVGPAARRLLPAAFLGGALLVVLADLAARSLSQRYDLPLGAVTALVGAPYFLVALRAEQGRT